MEDWPSANPRQAKKLQDVARSSSVPQIRVVADPILTLVDTAEWRQLTDARGSGFHRWRVQADGVFGVAKRSPWRQGDGVRSLEAGFGQPLGKDAPVKLAAQTLTIAVTARNKLVDTARAFDEVFDGAVTATTRLTRGAGAG